MERVSSTHSTVHLLNIRGKKEPAASEESAEYLVLEICPERSHRNKVGARGGTKYSQTEKEKERKTFVDEE